MSKDRLVLLASGWTKPKWLWTPMAYRFSQNGYDTIRLEYPNNGFSCISETADSMGDFLQLICPEYESVVFIGHSMGGLIGQKLIQNGFGGHFSAFVTLGTPHHGAPLAFLAPWSRSARQMKPKSTFLEELNAMQWPQHLPTLTISGGWDAIVPTWSSQLRSAENIVVDKVTHTTLLTNSQVFYEIWSYLTFYVFNDDAPLDRVGIGSDLSV